MFQIEIEGQPVPMGRPRHGQGRTYTPGPSRAAKTELMAKFRLYWGNMAPLEDGIELRVMFYMPLPRSWSLKKRMRLQGHPVTVKPDSDNLLKMVMDAGNGILWKDDATICSLYCMKVYSSNPRTYIEFDHEFL